MIKKLDKQPQLEMYRTVLVNFIHPEHELCQLVRKIGWDQLEKDLTPFYSEVGSAAVTSQDDSRSFTAETDL